MAKIITHFEQSNIFDKDNSYLYLFDRAVYSKGAITNAPFYLYSFINPQDGIKRLYPDNDVYRIVPLSYQHLQTLRERPLFKFNTYRNDDVISDTRIASYAIAGALGAIGLGLTNFIDTTLIWGLYYALMTVMIVAIGVDAYTQNKKSQKSHVLDHVNAFTVEFKHQEVEKFAVKSVMYTLMYIDVNGVSYVDENDYNMMIEQFIELDNMQFMSDNYHEKLIESAQGVYEDYRQSLHNRYTMSTERNMLEKQALKELESSSQQTFQFNDFSQLDAFNERREVMKELGRTNELNNVSIK